MSAKGFELNICPSPNGNWPILWQQKSPFRTFALQILVKRSQGLFLEGFLLLSQPMWEFPKGIFRWPKKGWQIGSIQIFICSKTWRIWATEELNVWKPFCLMLHSGKLTWQRKMEPWKMYFPLNIGIFHCYIGLPEGVHEEIDVVLVAYLSAPFWGFQ